MVRFATFPFPVRKTFDNCSEVAPSIGSPERKYIPQEERLKEIMEPEVVLKKQPTCLYIEVPNATDELVKTRGRSIYRLTVQVRPWSLDKEGNVKVMRFGFPIVPDFGGTAHAYCGSTMAAALGDLLSWELRPRHDDTLKAYIIKSRVKLAQQLLLSQPYSPHMFRQGLLPGPALLLDVLLGKKASKEAKAAWKAAMAKKNKKRHCESQTG